MIRFAAPLFPALLLPALLLLVALPVGADDDEDPNKVFLKGIGKAVKAGDVGAITRYFPTEGKVELRLNGVRGGKYRDQQARSLLASWFSKIEPKKVELKEIRGSVGVFKLKYRHRAHGTRVEGSLHVYFERRGESWLIVGIVES